MRRILACVFSDLITMPQHCTAERVGGHAQETCEIHHTTKLLGTLQVAAILSRLVSNHTQTSTPTEIPQGYFHRNNFLDMTPHLSWGESSGRSRCSRVMSLLMVYRASARLAEPQSLCKAAQL